MHFLDRATFYASWARSLDTIKLHRIRQLLPYAVGGRVLDVGCGPGNNVHIFEGANYTGVDINAGYIANARQLSPDQTFLVADVVNEPLPDGPFDIILVNSLLHHLDDPSVRILGDSLLERLTPDGSLLVNEPLIPEGSAPWQRMLMRLDRGGHFRSAEEYVALLPARLRVVGSNAYTLPFLGMTGWRLAVWRMQIR
jgi:SAM-dependent methyltransferase